MKKYEVPKFEDHERFLKFIIVDELSGCWRYGGYQNEKTSVHGEFRIKTKDGLWVRARANRVAYSIFIGNMDKNSQVLTQTCTTPLCINPYHMVATSRESYNINKFVKEFCKSGHLLDMDNAIVYKSGKTLCKKCRSIRESLPGFLDRRRASSIKYKLKLKGLKSDPT